MMQDYPAENTKSILPKTDREKKETLLFGLPFLAVPPAYPLAYGIYGKFVPGYDFLTPLVSVFLLFFSFNLLDLLILDRLLFYRITPRFMVLPGTEGNPGYKDYWFHFIGFLMGTGFVVLGSLVVSGLRSRGPRSCEHRRRLSRFAGSRSPRTNRYENLVTH